MPLLPDDTPFRSLPIRLVTYSESAYREGITHQVIDGVTVKIYDIPKTIADCFKFRNKIGLDVAIEALKDVVSNQRATVEQLLHASHICRVEKVITPYLESLL